MLIPRARPPRLLPWSVAAFALALVGCQSPQSPADTTADGSSTGAETGADETTGEELGDAPTWYQDIAPIVVGKCAGCHRPEGIAPFSLTDYEASKPWASLLASAVEDGAMPPWGQAATDECAPRFGFKNDIRLSDAEQEALRAWADADAPEGDPAQAAEVPAPPSVEIDDADRRLTPKSEITVDGNKDRFVCFVIDPELTEDAYIEAAQIVPGNSSIVHHVLVYSDHDSSSKELAGEKGYYECSGGGINGDELIAAWAPGALPSTAPPNTAYKLPAGSSVIVNIHYHPTGSGAEVDPGTSLDLKWYEGLPDYVAEIALIGNFDNPKYLHPGPNDEGGPQFRIPAGVDDHTETMSLVLPDEIPQIPIFAIATHMHYVGVDMRLDIKRAHPTLAQPEEECLLQTPHYSFEWQRSYAYDAPLEDVPTLRGGDELTMRCTYNNSMSNPYVVDALADLGLEAPVDVWLGEETLDEMCLGVYVLAVPCWLAEL